MFIDETLHTLQYANEAKKIKITIKKNIVDNRVLQVSKLDQYIQSLKSEINNIRMEIAEKEKVNMSMDVGEYQMDNSETYEQLKKDLINHFEEEIAVKNEIINKEKEIEMLKVEISENELNMNSNPTINTSAIQKMIN
jgi:predicted RNase H-like nuclease (RuvC/YqgF family)